MDKNWIEPEHFRGLLLNVRWIRRWTQRQLAEVAGVDKATIERYENGRVPDRRAAETLFAAAGFSLSWLEAMLLPALRAAAELDPRSVPPPGMPPSTLETLARGIEVAQIHLAAGMPAAGADGARLRDPAIRRKDAEELWAILEPCSPEEREILIEHIPAYRGWAAPDPPEVHARAAEGEKERS